MKILKYCIVLIVFLFVSCDKSFDKSNENAENILITNDRLKDSLSFELCKMHGLDQGIRESTRMKDKWSFIHPIDSINFHKTIDFIKEFGYPTKELLGEENFSFECVAAAAFAVLLHNPHIIVNNEEYVDLLLEEVNNGRLSLDSLLLFLDKYYVIRRDENGNPMLLYGSQFGKPCLSNRSKSDEARKKLGLEPLKDEEFKSCD